MTVLLREAIGDRLRHARTTQSRTLREVSRAARVSLGYLSEVERGRKEASSELLAAICDALDLPLSELLYTVAEGVRAVDEMSQVPVPTTSEPLPETVSTARLQANASVATKVVDTELAELWQPVLRPRLTTTITPTNRGVVVAA